MYFYTHVSTIGDKVVMRYINTDSKTNQTQSIKVQHNPTLYTISNGESTQYQSIHGVSLDQHSFDGQRAYWDFHKQYQGVDNFPLYGDISPAIQFISDRFEQSITFDFNLLRIFYIDIEVYSADGKFPEPDKAEYPVSAISIYDSITDIYYQWGLEYDGCWYGANGYDPKKRHADKQIAYAGFTNEEELLKHFLSWWKKFCPDIITGWNITTFDIPYLINRMKNEYPDLKPSKLSPWGKIRERTMEMYNKPHQIYQIDGVSDLDYLIQYKKHSFTPQESYTLDHVANAELGEGKLSYDEVSGLHELYRVDYQKYIDYNVKDSNRVLEIDRKRGILFLIVSVAYRSKCNFEDIISPLRTWDALIYNHLKQQNTFCPPRQAHSKKSQYVGAYVKEPIPGRYDWVVSVDLASLYPSLIRQINISPETLIRAGSYDSFRMGDCVSATMPDLIDKKADLSGLKIPEYDFSFAANRTFYQKETRGFLPYLLEQLYLERVEDKSKMINAQQKLEQVKREIAILEQ